MAIEKALFTSQADFTKELQLGIGTSDPFLSYSGDSTGKFTEKGNPVSVPGLKGNAKTFTTGMAYVAPGNLTATKTRHVMSMFIKPTASDLVAGNNWRILASNRGWGKNNYGIHLALYGGALNCRIYGTSGTLDIYSLAFYGMIERYFEADRIYHIIMKYDESDTFPLEVWVDDDVWIYSGVKTANLNGITNSYLTLGDMPTGIAGTKAYPFNGWIDEFNYFTGESGSMPTIETLRTEYRKNIFDANWIDTWTEPGTMILGSNVAVGGYTNKGQIWDSPPIDIGDDGFGDFGRVQVNFEQPGNTGINIFTRSSSNGTNWNNWIKVQDDGQINSPDTQYLQIRVEFYSIDPKVTPKIMEIQVLDYPKRKRLSLTKEPLVIYRDLSTGLERMGELVNAYDIYIIEEINGEETLEFKMATNDPKRKELGAEPVELIAQIGDKRFIIRNPLDKRDNGGKKYTEFFAESLWYELRDAKVIEFESVEDTAFNTMQKILAQSIEPTGWSVYIAEPTIRRTIRGEWKSVLELLHEVRNQFGGELQFDTVNRTISLVRSVGENNGVRFYYNKNLKTIERSVDTFNLITRLYVYGKNGMTIKSVNDQFPNEEYIENTFWVDQLKLRNRIRIDRWSDGRYTVPHNLLSDGRTMLNELAKPNVAYAMEVNDLSMLSGHEHESIGLGDVVYAVDTELLNLLVESRIMRRKYNVRQPWKTEVELNQPKKELADANQRNIDDSLELLAETDPLDTSDVQQMTVFNHLLNSRAEDGTAYWEETGTGISNAIGGFSGNSSWQVVGGYGKTNILKQSIFGVSHRSAYTVSAYVASEGTITRGPTNDAFVGIRVRIHYTEPDNKGNTYEDHYLAIPDITQEGGGEEDGS